MALRIRGARVLRGGTFVSEDVLMDSPGPERTIDGRGLVLAPAFCDLHVHLRQPGFEQKETIKTGTRAAARGGFTTVCAMPNLSPVPDSAEHVRVQLDIVDRDACVEVLPYMSITEGRSGKRAVDIPSDLSRVAGFSDDGNGVQPDDVMRLAMRRVRAAGSFIAAHCEDDSLLIPGGCVSTGCGARFGLPAISNESEWRQIERDIRLAEETGCRYHVCHISTAESVGLVRQAKKRGLPVTAEVTPHHLLLCDEDIQSDDGKYKMNPPLRSAIDRKALWDGVRDGTIECIATDHAPHTAEEKARGLLKSAMGIVGLETAFAVSRTALEDQIAPERLLAMLGENPRRVLGRPAPENDWVLLDWDAPVSVDPQKFLSMGKSTPFAGMALRGRVVMTIRGGSVLYDGLC